MRKYPACTATTVQAGFLFYGYKKQIQASVYDAHGECVYGTHDCTGQ